MGLRATVHPMAEVAAFLGGDRPVEIVDTSVPPRLAPEPEGNGLPLAKGAWGSSQPDVLFFPGEPDFPAPLSDDFSPAHPWPPRGAPRGAEVPGFGRL